MKCQDVQEWFGAYFDLPEGDELRRAVDEHVRHCETCREEFRIWRESAELIRGLAGADEYLQADAAPVAKRVMQRIYEDESWRMPVPERLYSFSYRLRRNLTAFIAFCMTLFIFGFVFSVTGAGLKAEDAPPHYGLKPVAAVLPDSQSSSIFSFQGAVASLKDPYMITMGPVRTVPDYMIVFSLLGLTAAILIMNWLSRTKA
jgi:hypothetical protein